MREHQAAYFLRASVQFLVGLALVLAACEAGIGRWVDRKRSAGLIGGEVALALRHSKLRSNKVKAVYLGDSVAHQLLQPGTEPSPAARFLTTNQAISSAGQCYLLENALRAFPNLRDAYLVYVPACFANNLPPELSHDYFCGYFHSPSQVCEVFAVKRDFELSAAHVGRMLLPNLLLQNSMWQRAPANAPPETKRAPAAYFVQAAPDAEPLLGLLTRWFQPAPEPARFAAGSYGPVLPTVSKYFVPKMQKDCAARGVRLHILPCPLSTRETYADSQHIFSAPPLRVDPSLLMDPVHFRPENIPQWRANFIAAYKLSL